MIVVLGIRIGIGCWDYSCRGGREVVVIDIGIGIIMS